MDARMVYRILRLEHAALIRIVTTLWNQDDIKTSLVNLYYSSLDVHANNWRKMEDRVTGKALELQLSKSLKESVLGLIKPIGQRILNWMKDHNDLSVRITVPTELCWTAEGTVDEKKTAECLIKDMNLNIFTRYKLACINCLEDDVRELWKEIPESRKHTLYRKKAPGIMGHKLVVFWTYAMKGEVDNLDIIVFENSVYAHGALYQRAFQYAALNGCKVATVYFLQKLTSVEREECLANVAAEIATRNVTSYIPRENYPDILCFLLSQMSEEQQVEVFKKCPHGVLRCLLAWPWQEFFMKTAKRLCIFLSKYHFNQLLHLIAKEAVRGRKDYNYQSLLGQFWQESLTAHKEYAVDYFATVYNAYFYLLSDLLRVKDRENVKLILKDASTLKGEDFIFSDGGRRICETLIHEGENDTLKFFLSMQSKNTLIKFKGKVRERIESTARVTRSNYINSFEEKRIERENNLCIQLLEVLVDLIRKYDKKRPAEKGNLDPPKKLCT